MKPNRGYKHCHRCKRFVKMGHLHTCPGEARAVTVDVDLSKCPACSAVIDSAMGECLGRGTPVPGDTSLCLECETPLLITDELTLRVITQSEFRALKVEDQLQIWKGLVIVREYKQKHRPST